MKTLYIGDIMGERGIEAVRLVLPEMRKEHQLDLVIAQAENVSEGRGLTRDDFGTLQTIGIDFMTGGNWTLHRSEIYPLLDDPLEPIVRPANYPADTPGQGWKYVTTEHGKVLVISLLGKVVGRDADKPIDNPLHVVDDILQQNRHIERLATLVNFHGDYSSEKVIIGQYLDGRVTAVVGDHWHVPTADAQVLPKGTAHITDVGMCGVLHASLGISFDSVIPRWRDGTQTQNQLETKGPLQFNAVLIESDNQTGLATAVASIRKILYK